MKAHSVSGVTSNTHFHFAHALRGIAALWVVLFHADEGGHIPSLTAALPSVLTDVVFRAGHYGVPIFFALSGFVIAHSVRNVALTRGAYGRFILRRSIRLDPPYWASIVIVLAFAFIEAQVKHEPFTPPPPATIIAHLFYVQGFVGRDTINTVYWTLTFEVQFYLFFVGMLALAHRFERARRAIWVMMFVLALASAGRWLGWAPAALFITLWSAFFIGVLAYRALDDRAVRWPAILLAAVMILFGGTFQAFSAITAVLLWLTGSGRLPWQLRRFRGLGTISYSLYLIHNPVSGAAGFVAHKLLGHGVLADVGALLLIVTASISTAAILWWTIERPSHRLSRLVPLQKMTLRPSPA